MVFRKREHSKVIIPLGAHFLNILTVLPPMARGGREWRACQLAGPQDPGKPYCCAHDQYGVMEPIYHNYGSPDKKKILSSKHLFCIFIYNNSHTQSSPVLVCTFTAYPLPMAWCHESTVFA